VEAYLSSVSHIQQAVQLSSRHLVHPSWRALMPHEKLKVADASARACQAVAQIAQTEQAFISV